MDRRLCEAAKTGDVHHLQSLIKEDPLLLRAVSLAGNESPLHISCLSGHLEFSKEIIHLMPEFARELNQDGFSPLHIASANGDIEIELLVASPDSAEEVTARGETCLHLAVKNYQFEAFKVLLDNLKDLNKYGLLNKKDIQGNTVLHLAVSTKQYEVVDMLLGENAVSKGTIEVNSLNKKGLNTFGASGALSAENLQVLVVPVQDPSNEQSSQVLVVPVQDQQSSREQTRDDGPRSNVKKLQDFFRYNKTKDCPGKVRDTILVIAILIATATYQAGFNPPGGLWQDTYWPDDGNNNSPSYDGIEVVHLRHFAGQSVMATSHPIPYGLFLVFNSLGFFVSLHAINFLTIGFPLRLELQVSLVVLAITYFTVVLCIIPYWEFFFLFVILIIVFPVLLPLIVVTLRNFCNKPRFLS
ncbi:hypothetical protein R3W88_002194 [Solanum pinnatisectum]|uniref:PGG domain-containing protein n=1 Tax=Solanum pinnatisectum TaxID=50273 RepID=A0AAV9MMD5_9SOLN|nr:hypothetical protein R3W88_002194 [Solanum pinnatisectum]